LAIPEFMAARAAELTASLADPWQWVALGAAGLAAVLIVVSAFVKTIIPLRWLAVASNTGFIVYGLMHPALLILALHLTLLPINLWRVAEMHRLTRRVRRAAAPGSAVQVWLRPYMKRRYIKRGEVLFRRGDPADRLYFLADGRLEVVEKSGTIEAGRMFGEIAFFAPEGRRTATVRCIDPGAVLSIDETTFKQLLFQNPEFGLEILTLVAGHLSSDVRRLEAVIEQLKANAPPPR
jgi:hypothetical protein